MSRNAHRRFTWLTGYGWLRIDVGEQAKKLGISSRCGSARVFGKVRSPFAVDVQVFGTLLFLPVELVVAFIR